MLVNPTADDSPEGAFDQWRGQQERAWGYVPNYAALFSGRPDVAEAWSRLNLAVREGMDRRRFELATIAAARARSSTYCVAAHSGFLRDVCGDEPTMLALAADPAGSSLEPADREVVAFAAKVATDPASVGPEDVEALRAVGLTDDDVTDVVLAVAARCFFATVLDAGGAEADAQLGGSFDEDTRARLTVGRPFAAASEA